MSRFAETYVRFAGPIVAAGLALVAAGAVLLVRPGLREDYSIRSFVGGHSAAYLRYEHFLERFAGDELALIAIRGDDPLSPRSLALTQTLSERIAALEGVESVQDLSKLPLLPPAEGSTLLRVGRLMRAMLAPRTVRDELTEHPDRREAVRRKLMANPIVRGTLLSPLDARTFAVLIRAGGEAADGGRRLAVVSALRSIVEDARAGRPDLQIVLAGPLVTMIDIFEYLHRDLAVFAVLVSLLIGAVLLGIFRRIDVLALAVLAAWGSTVATLGLGAALQVPMSLVTDMIVILVTVVAVAMCVHLFVTHEEVCATTDLPDRRARAVGVLQRAGLPCVFVALTTGVGFGALRISNLAPVRNFAMLILFGILLALLLPTAAVALLRAPGASARPRSPRAMGPWLGRLVGAASRRPRAVIAGFVVITAALTTGIGRLEFQSDFVKNFRTGSEVRESYAFIQRYLAPLGSLELVLTTAPGRSLVRPDVIAGADRLVRDVVRELDLIGKGLSLADLLTLGVLPLPANEADLKIRLAVLHTVGGGRMLRSFLSDDGEYLRINFRAREAGRVDEKLAMPGRILDVARRSLPPDVHVEVTGLYPFYAGLVGGLLRDQYRSFALAVVGIFAAMWLAMRSFRVAVVSMIPNLLPMMLILGLMGWLGIRINMATAMMLSVSLGIAVDNTIHYLWRVRRELAVDGDYVAAMGRAHATVGRACVFSAVVIAGGFWILCFSEFLPTAYFGAMVGLTMLCALAADMVLLPVLLLVVRPFRSGPS